MARVVVNVESDVEPSVAVGGRRRIGLIVSAAWIVGAVTSLTLIDFRVARLLRYAAFEACDYINHHVCQCGNCWGHMMKAAQFVDHPLMNFTLIALAPLAMGWFVGSVMVRFWKR